MSWRICYSRFYNQVPLCWISSGGTNTNDALRLERFKGAVRPENIGKIRDIFSDNLKMKLSELVNIISISKEFQIFTNEKLRWRIFSEHRSSSRSLIHSIHEIWLPATIFPILLNSKSGSLEKYFTQLRRSRWLQTPVWKVSNINFIEPVTKWPFQQMHYSK